MRDTDYYANKGAQIKPFNTPNKGAAQAHEAWSSTKFKPTNCQSTNKKGMACKARPANGTEFCIGHLKAGANE